MLSFHYMIAFTSIFHQLLKYILKPDLLGHIWQLWKRVTALRTPDGLYEVLEYESRIIIHDVKGKKVTLQKRQRVRFLQNNIIAYQDQAWGDGDIFADYKCSPGVAVDRYREGHRYHILISLRGTKNKGDLTDFLIERVIENGFTQDVEDFQTEINHVTNKLTFNVIFPRRRFPKKVILIEQNSGRSQVLGTKHKLTLPDGRQQFRWRTNKPKRFEAYIMRWEW
jgi:hypothetical protein